MKAKLYISRENLKYNIEYIKKKAGQKDIIAMVKANAYGAGDTLIAKELETLGIKNFGVANIQEAERLRGANVSGMIIITSVVDKDEAERAIDGDISMSVSDINNIIDVNEAAKKKQKKARIHIKIDTGMTRLGFSSDNIIVNFQKICALENIEVEGIYTHLSCADSDKEFTLSQIKEFKKVVIELQKSHEFKYIHILNSDGLEKYSDVAELRGVDTHVRVGIIMYGYLGGTRPILKLTAPIIHLSNTTKYVKVSYSGTYIAKPNEKIAVVKIGYADGISRCLSNNLTVSINGVGCRQIGNICMDMMMISIPQECKGVEASDEVTIFDYSDDLKDIAKKSNKIVYEVISNLGDRIERILK